jgi:hypothetical protein
MDEEKKAINEAEVSPAVDYAGAEPAKPRRQILIETDGDAINLVKAEVSGKIELAAVLQLLLEHIKTSK